jgi:hypothetical protein
MAKIQGVPPPPHQTDDWSDTSSTRAAMGPVGSVNASTSPAVSEELTPDNEEIGFPQVIANLIVSEAACLSIHSDVPMQITGWQPCTKRLT